MATAGASLTLAAAPVGAINPIVGFIALTAAALFDQYVTVPRLQGKGKGAARADRLLGVPADSNEPGAPRVWAIGRRVRVPTHTLWQDQKALESTSGSSKRGTTVQQRRTYFDALISLNDRPTKQLVQLRGNNTMLLFKSRNLVSTESPNMLVSVVGPSLVLTMASTADPDFTLKHAVGDAVQLAGFINSGLGQSVNGYWKVTAVTKHTTTPSAITLQPYQGQIVLGMAATSGTPFSPASVTRVDDVIFVETQTVTGGFSGYRATPSGHLTNPSSLLPIGQQASIPVLLEGFFTTSGSVDNYEWVGAAVTPFSGGEFVDIIPISGPGQLGFPPPGPLGPTNPGRIRVKDQKPFAAPLFPPTFNPALYYHEGSDTQGENALITAKRGTGNVSAYRGIAYQGLDDFYANDFGNALPFAMEAIIDPDSALTWGEALRIIFRDRAGYPDAAIDVEGVNDRPFLGAYFRGPVAMATAIQPILIAGQILTQERDGVLAMFDIGNSDVVTLRNDPGLSHLACRLDTDPPADDKVVVEDVAEEDLPSSVGIRHQDPDNQFADGYQHFGLRGPSGVDWENAQEFDLSNVVLTRKDARNLATTTLRRAHINARRYRLSLPANYIHLLENDVVTFVDDEGQTIVARIAQRDIGSDFRVNILALREDINLQTVAAPVQSAAGIAPETLSTAGAIDEAYILDIPAWEDADVVVPSLAFAATVANPATWAGASVWESPDGTTYTQVGTITDTVQIGQSLFALNPTSLPSLSSEVYGSTLVTSEMMGTSANFQFRDEAFAMESATVAEAARGANWFALIDPNDRTKFEIVAACSVTNDGTPGLWQLDTMLRGLRGTQAFDWPAGTIAVQLTTKTGARTPIWRRNFPGTIQATSLVYKLVPPGLTIDDVDPVGVSAQWHNARPLPVRSVSKAIGSSPFDATFTVVAHWCRDVQEVGTQPPHPMDEPTEGYRFTIYDPTGSFVIRTKTIQASPGSGTPTLRDKWVVYTAAEQTADGYTPGASTTFWLDVQQIGQFGLSPSRKRLL